MNKNTLLQLSYYAGLGFTLTGVTFKVQQYPGNEFLLFPGLVLSLTFIVLALTEIVKSPYIRGAEKAMWIAGLFSVSSLAGLVYVTKGRKRIVR